jgi:hypothetical protein
LTHDEWANSDSPQALYQFVGGDMSRRQARLLMVALCRLVAAEPADPRVRLVLETAERCADDPALEASADAIWKTFITTPSQGHCFPKVGPEADMAKAVVGAWELVTEVREPSAIRDYERYASPRAALAQAVLMSLREAPQDCFTGGDGDAVEYCIRGVEFALTHKQVELLGRAGPTGHRPLAEVLRCVLGNLVRPAVFEPVWRTEAAVGLARGMYESRDFGPMPVLADALEDAGCAAEGVLAHCRGDGPHARGCFVVDAVLGKA